MESRRLILAKGAREYSRKVLGPGANLKSISNRCYHFEVAFVWELTKETIVFPMGCL